jgi:hypothetical protein
MNIDFVVEAKDVDPTQRGCSLSCPVANAIFRKLSEFRPDVEVSVGVYAVHVFTDIGDVMVALPMDIPRAIRLFDFEGTMNTPLPFKLDIPIEGLLA